MSIKLVDQLFVLISWVLFPIGREKEHLPGTYGLPLWTVTELGSFHHHGPFFPFTLPTHCLLPKGAILAGRCVTLGKESREKAEGVICGGTGLETCQYERKDAFRISAMVASHLKLGEATSNSGFTAQFKKGSGGVLRTILGPCAGPVFVLQLGSFIHFYQPSSSTSICICVFLLSCPAPPSVLATE